MAENDFSFNFKLPSEDLGLRSVAINSDGTPELIFDASMNVPTLTQEDVGTACRLACEGRRPEFFYYPIPIYHPFYGRQYKHYCPEWLKRTSIGDLLSEADWTMKCLNIGARSDENKEKFWAWQHTSKLVGLADMLDFPPDSDKPPGSIIMSCDSVKVQRNENELIFIEEPKMRIDCDGCSTYSRYITDIYPSIAFHDEPLFLKMQELIKLVLAAEWLKEKGVRFNSAWMTRCSAPQSESSQAIEVKSKGLGEDKIREMMLTKLKELPETAHQEILTRLGRFSVDTLVEKDVSESGIKVKMTRTASSPCTKAKVEETLTTRASVNDRDMLYEGLDPKMPIVLWPDREIIPNVQSWSELFSETVPWPRTWIKPKEGPMQVFSTSGGVSTSKIPVTEVAKTRESMKAATKVRTPQGAVKVEENMKAAQGAHGQYNNDGNGHLTVKAERGEGKQSRGVCPSLVPQPKIVAPPENDVTSQTPQTEQNRKQSKAEERGFGYSTPNEIKVFDKKGGLSNEGRLMNFTLDGRRQVVPVTNDLLSPSNSTVSSDSGISSIASPQDQYAAAHQLEGATSGLSPSDSAFSNDSGNDSPNDDMDTNQ